jgi:hypothetical protein
MCTHFLYMDHDVYRVYTPCIDSIQGCKLMSAPIELRINQLLLINPLI